MNLLECLLNIYMNSLIIHNKYFLKLMKTNSPGDDTNPESINNFNYGCYLNKSQEIDASKKQIATCLLENLITYFCSETEVISVGESPLSNGNMIKIIYTNSYKYIGETNTLNKPHGFGICEYRNNYTYIGQFLEGKFNGIGKLLLGNGEAIQGEFENNQISGFYEHIINNVTIQGKYSEHFNGENFMSYKKSIPTDKSNNIIIDGEFDQTNDYSGLGKLICEDKKLYYKGEFVNFISNGWGIASVKDKFIYKGSHNLGKFNGYGEMYYPDGYKFFGFFKQNSKHGFSISINQEGKVSFGKYIDNIKHGPFLIYFKNVIVLELFNYGFKSRVFDRFESSKNYFKQFYPEFDWVVRINMKKIADYFSEIRAEEYIDPAAPEDCNLKHNKQKCVNKDKMAVNSIVNDKKEVSLIQKIRESMKRDLESA